MNRTLFYALGWAAVLGFAVAGLCGCVSTPQPIVQANTMALETLDVYEQNVNMVIDALVEENAAQNARRYNEQLQDALAQIVDADGKTDLVKYSQLLAAYQKEIDAGTDYYVGKGEELKAKLAAQMKAARTLLNANTAWLEAAGIPPEQFNEIVNNLFAVGAVTIEQSNAKSERDAAASAASRAQRLERINALPETVANVTDLVNRIRAELPERPATEPQSLQALLDKLRSQQ